MSLHSAFILAIVLPASAKREDGEPQQSPSLSNAGSCHGWKCFDAKEIQDELLKRRPSGQEVPFCDLAVLDAEAISDDTRIDPSLKETPFILRSDEHVLSMQRIFGREHLMSTGSSHGLTSRVGYSWDIVMNKGEGDKHVALPKYVESLMHKDNYFGGTRLERIYAFDRHSDLLSLPGFGFKIHPVIDSFNKSAFTPETSKPIFLLGGPESGISFHRHASALQMTVHGWKRWFFYAPEKHPPGGIHGAWPVLDWFRYVYPKLSKARAPLECVQQPGDILYIPEGWYHAVINLADSAAVSLQRDDLETEGLSLEFDARSAENIKGHEKRLKRLMKLQPDNLEARLLLFKAFKRAQPDKALKILSRAISKDPFFVDAQYDLANFFGERARAGASGAMEDLKAALLEWKPHLENNTLNLQANHMLSQLHFLTGQQDVGLRYLQRNVALQDAGINSRWVPNFRPILQSAMQAR